MTNEELILFESEGGFMKEIYQCKSIEEIKGFIAKLELIKHALKMAKVFNEQSVKFAKLEAECLVKIVSLGGVDELVGQKKETALWLHGMSENDREKYISRCEDGMSIVLVWKQAVKYEKDAMETINEAKTVEKELFSSLKENGIVNTHFYSSMVYDSVGKYDNTLARDMVDGLRVRLRNAGAVGVGFDSNIYVMPEKGVEYKEEICKAIIQRYCGVIKDLHSIIEISSKSKCKVPLSSLESVREISKGSVSKEEYGVINALCLAGVVFDDDCKSFYKYAEKNGYRALVGSTVSV